VLGHDGGTTNIRRIAGGNGEFEQQPITQAESRTYAHVREAEYDKTVRAIYLGFSAGILIHGNEYVVSIAKLHVGKPIQIMVPKLDNKIMEYKDIASFARSWQVVG
jgi:RNA binding exosome subunit